MVWYKINRNLHVGKYTYGRPHVYNWTNKYHVRIGKFCSISSGVVIIVDGNHNTGWISTYPFGKKIAGFKDNGGHPTGKGDIVIGNDVWIGMNVTILPGVRIGDGAVIGADSTVTRSVADYSIVAGNPARHVKYRFTDGQIRALKQIGWWDWPIEKIRDNEDLLQSEDIDRFITKHRQIANPIGCYAKNA